MTPGCRAAAMLVVAVAMAPGVEAIGRGGGQEPAAAARGAPTWKVRPSRRETIVSAPGTIEAVRAEAVSCEIEGGAMIIKLMPEGQRVKKGDVVVELDSTPFKKQLINQRVASGNAEDRHAIATLEREAAELALREYAEGILPKERDDLERTIEGGRAALRKIDERLERTRQARERLQNAMAAAGGARTPADVVAEVVLRDRLDEAELSRDRECRALARAEDRREVLERFTRPKRVKELEVAVKKARLDELACREAWEKEEREVSKLERKIAGCALVAPMDGTVAHGHRPGDVTLGVTPIGIGARVRQRQVVFRVLDLDGPMQVNVKVSESEVDRVAPKMKARVKLDDFPSETLAGFVGEINVLPDGPIVMAAWAGPKVYTTRILIGRGPDGLRPEMMARADIVVSVRDDVLAVPEGAVVRQDDRARVAVKAADGRVEWREVVPGGFDGSTIEVREGLRAGEEVIVDPRPFLPRERRNRGVGASGGS